MFKLLSNVPRGVKSTSHQLLSAILIIFKLSHICMEVADKGLETRVQDSVARLYILKTLPMKYVSTFTLLGRSTILFGWSSL